MGVSRSWSLARAFYYLRMLAIVLEWSDGTRSRRGIFLTLTITLWIWCDLSRMRHYWMQAAIPIPIVNNPGLQCVSPPRAVCPLQANKSRLLTATIANVLINGPTDVLEVNHHLIHPFANEREICRRGNSNQFEHHHWHDTTVDG